MENGRIEGSWSGMRKYLEQEILAPSLESDNVLERMFALLDRRVGKRTLQAQAASMDDQPEWLQKVYQLRLTAENITISSRTV